MGQERSEEALIFYREMPLIMATEELMNSFKFAFIAVLLTATFAGCTHVEKRKAIEGDVSKPYDSLGTLEVHVRTNPWKPINWWNDVKEISTVTLANTSYDKRLREKLVEDSKKYGADQVIKVEFWPPLDSKHFPEGKVFARGEMIKYRRFETAAA